MILFLLKINIKHKFALKIYNENNIDSYEALEEILKWKRTKTKRNKTKDRIDIELSIRNLFNKLNKS